ncbi:MAG: GNAT family N-acetyltransferase [Myxococcota bacterium]
MTALAPDRASGQQASYRWCPRVGGVPALIYQTITVESGRCADVHEWSGDGIEELVSLTSQFDSVDVVLSCDDNQRLERFRRAGFERQAIALVYMPLQSYECLTSLSKTSKLPDGIRSRWATVRDVRTLVPMMQELLALAGRTRSESEVARLIEARLEQPDWSGGYLLFEDERGLVAALNLYLDAEAGAQIFDFVVAPRLRNRGLGVNVYGHVGRTLHEQRFEMLSGEVDLANRPALSFWVRALGGLVDDEHVSMIRKAR